LERIRARPPATSAEPRVQARLSASRPIRDTRRQQSVEQTVEVLRMASASGAARG
jgi:hypothetical protein